MEDKRAKAAKAKRRLEAGRLKVRTGGDGMRAVDRMEVECHSAAMRERRRRMVVSEEVGIVWFKRSSWRLV